MRKADLSQNKYICFPVWFIPSYLNHFWPVDIACNPTERCIFVRYVSWDIQEGKLDQWGKYLRNNPGSYKWIDGHREWIELEIALWRCKKYWKDLDVWGGVGWVDSLLRIRMGLVGRIQAAWWFWFRINPLYEIWRKLAKIPRWIGKNHALLGLGDSSLMCWRVRVILAILPQYPIRSRAAKHFIVWRQRAFRHDYREWPRSMLNVIFLGLFQWVYLKTDLVGIDAVTLI